MDITSILMQQVAAGTIFTNTATVTSATPEYTTGNNTASVTGATVSLADLFVNKTMQTFTGYQAGSIITYTISYGNSG